MESEIEYLIYKHTNKINGKIYVGQTGQSPEDRWKNGYGYKEIYIDKNGNKKYSHFFNAIQKYGWDNFEHKVLIHGLTKEQADIWEKKLIKSCDLMNRDKGYNKKEGGSRGKLSDETIEKIRQANIGKKHTKETKEKLSKIFKGRKNYKISQSLKEYYKTHDGTAKGRILSDETKQKLSQSHKGKPSPKIGIKLNDIQLKKLRNKSLLCKKIICLNNLKVYVSQTRAGEDLGITHKHIHQVCKGSRKHTFGYRFMYFDDFIKDNSELINNIKYDEY